MCPNPHDRSNKAPLPPGKRTTRQAPPAKRSVHVGFNPMWLFVPLLLAAVVGGGVYALYRLQLRRQVNFALTEAEARENSGDFKEAAQHLQDYLVLRPNDFATARRRAADLEHVSSTSAEKQHLLAAYDLAERIAPASEKQDLRRRQAELLFEIGRFSDAVERADLVLRESPKDRSALHVRAMGLYAQVTPDSPTAAREATTACRQAFDSDRTNVEMARTLSVLLREHGPRLTEEQQRESANTADAVYDELLQASPDAAPAWLARYRYKMRYRLPDAADDLNKALELAPEDPDVLSDAGGAAAIQGDFTLAAERFERIVALRPKSAMAYFNLAHFYIKLDDRQRAEEVWSRAAQQLDDVHPILWMQRAESLIRWGRIDEAESAIKELTKTVEGLAGRAPPATVEQLSNRTRFLRGLLLSARGDYRGALALLEKVDLKSLPNELSVSDEQRAEVWASRGAAHRGLGQWDLAAHAYERAASLTQDNPNFLTAAADCYLRVGRSDVSARLMERAARDDDAGPEHRLYRVQSLIKRASRVTTNEAAWAEIYQELDELAKEPDLLAATLELRAETATKQGKFDEAVVHLENAQAQLPAGRPPLAALVLAYEATGARDRADAQLERMRAADPNSATTAIAGANLLLRRGQATPAREALLAAIDKAPDADRPLIVAGLADLYRQTMRPEEARVQLEALVKAHPDNLSAAERLAAAAWQTGALELLEKTEEQIKTLEGDEGIQWRYFRCLRLTRQWTGSQDRRYLEASRLLREIQALRPGMALSAVLTGFMAEREGKHSLAIDAYRRAVDLGYSEPDVLEPLVKLLLRQNRGVEAEQFAARLQESVASAHWSASAGAASSGTLASVRLEQLRQAVADQPQSAAPSLALGQALVSAGQLEEAEQTFAGATQKFPNDRGTWTALAALFVRLGRADDYKATLAKLEADQRFTSADRLLISALALELGGRLGLADQKFREIAALNPPSVEGLQSAARFFATSDLSLAIECLRQVRQLNPKSHDSTRLLAKLLFSMDNASALAEVKQLIQDLPAEEAYPIAKRLEAFQSLAAGSPEQLLQAIQSLNELTLREEAEPLDRLAFARALEKAGRHDSARNEYLQLASSTNVSPLYLISFIEFLLRRDDLKAADQWLRMLEPRMPNDLRPVALRALWLRQSKRVDEIPAIVHAGVARVVSEAPNEPSKLRAMLAGATILAGCGLDAEVQRIVAQVMERGSASYLPLAVWLTKEGKNQQALDLCIRSLRDNPTAEAAMQMVATVSLDPSIAESNDELESLLAEVMPKYSTNQLFQVALATLRQVQGRTDEARQLFDQLLEKNPSNVFALNNVAVMLADKPETREQALEYVDRAIKLRGMQSQLADTRGWILFQQDKLAEAQRHFDRAIQDTPTDPRFHFHLALVKQRQGDSTGARTSLELAKKLNLLTQGLVPDERRLLQGLEQLLSN